MKDEALALVRDVSDPALRLNRLREYLQAFVLRSLHESEAFSRVAFVGGTALRLLFGLPRFSEDLDFSLERKDGYEPRKWLEKAKRDLSAAGFDPSLSWNDRKTVHTAWIRIAGLLQPAGLAGLPAQKLSIRLEVDTRPPKGAVLLKRIVNRHMLVALQSHDLPSLMAGKLHALLTRRFPKGRDWYDLVWYRATSPPTEPNLTLLQNALDQTEGKGARDASRWRDLAINRLASLDTAALRKDVEPFLERPREAELLTEGNLRATLAGEGS